MEQGAAGSAGLGTSAGHIWRKLVREPLVQFLAIGVVVFASYGWTADGPVARTGATIEVTPEQVARLAGQFEAVWRRAPSGEERSRLVEDFIREEVYYREALALGLDREDAVIRRRLRQKMEFLSATGAGGLSPGEAELLIYFAENEERFASPPQVTFRQVHLGPTESAEAALEALDAGADPKALGRPSLLPPVMEEADETTVDGTFGQGFFAGVAALPPGEWRGPVASAFGAHVVLVLEAGAATLPDFDEVRESVEADWRREAAEALREAHYQALRAQYEVVLPGQERPE